MEARFITAMKPQIGSSLAFAAVLAVACGGEVWATRYLSARAEAERATVSDYENMKRRDQEASDRKKQLEKDGDAKFTLALSEQQRKQLPARFDRLFESHKLTAVTSDAGDRHFEYQMRGTPADVLRFLLAVDQQLPELRLRSTNWSADAEGALLVTAAWDVWQLPRMQTQNRIRPRT